ncbi:unnamed protein product, partial [Ixodes pacificus]
LLIQSLPDEAGRLALVPQARLNVIEPAQHAVQPVLDVLRVHQRRLQLVALVPNQSQHLLVHFLQVLHGLLNLLPLSRARALQARQQRLGGMLGRLDEPPLPDSLQVEGPHAIELVLDRLRLCCGRLLEQPLGVALRLVEPGGGPLDGVVVVALAISQAREPVSEPVHPVQQVLVVGSHLAHLRLDLALRRLHVAQAPWKVGAEVVQRAEVVLRETPKKLHPRSHLGLVNESLGGHGDETKVCLVGNDIAGELVSIVRNVPDVAEQFLMSCQDLMRIAQPVFEHLHFTLQKGRQDERLVSTHRVLLQFLKGSGEPPEQALTHVLAVVVAALELVHLLLQGFQLLFGEQVVALLRDLPHLV